MHRSNNKSIVLIHNKFTILFELHELTTSCESRQRAVPTERNIFHGIVTGDNKVVVVCSGIVFAWHNQALRETLA